MSQQDFILPFRLEKPNLRGRLIRLDSVLDDILTSHDYPPVIAAQMAESVLMTGLLASLLKYEGIFTLQVQGQIGALKMMVADMTHLGGLRGCAAFDSDQVEKMPEHSSLKTLIGEKGYMAFTVDHGGDTDRYQGIVPLDGETLSACVNTYFQTSEQTLTGTISFAKKTKSGWRGQAVLLQKMPEDEQGETHLGNVREDDWRRTMVLLQSAKEEEMLSPDISAQEMLFRLFHEEEIRVYDTRALTKDCRCSRKRLGALLHTMSDDDLEHMTVDRDITMRCEFCSRDFVFNASEIMNARTEALEE